MMKKTIVSIVLTLAFCLGVHADEVPVLPTDGDSTGVLYKYIMKLQQLADQRDSLATFQEYSIPNAYYFQMMSAPTLYGAPLHQMMSHADSLSNDQQVQRLYDINRALAKLYVSHPGLVWQTDQQIKEQGKFRDDVNEKINANDKLAEKVTEATLAPTLDDDIVVITRRPNFWKISGNTALQLAQNYFSKNWYQGGETHYSGTGTVNLRVNFNDQKKLTWDNLLELQLGFQTSKSDTKRAFRPTTSNVIRYTTNFGYKAYKNLSYSGQVRVSTQIVPNYQSGTDIVISDIFSPMDITVAPGIKYIFQYGKKKRFTGTLNVAPLAWNIRYCARKELVERYNGKGEHRMKHSFGPNVTLDSNWKICNQITWSSKIYWFSNLEFTRIEWTNQFNFSVTKLISAQITLYPRFDDSNINYRRNSKHDSYIMFKEWMSMGINYNF